MIFQNRWEHRIGSQSLANLGMNIGLKRPGKLGVTLNLSSSQPESAHVVRLGLRADRDVFEGRNTP